MRFLFCIVILNDLKKQKKKEMEEKPNSKIYIFFYLCVFVFVGVSSHAYYFVVGAQLSVTFLEFMFGNHIDNFFHLIKFY